MERYDINSIPKANTAEAGALRVANSVDEKNCGCVDAAITPSNLYNLLGCRKANTSYTVGETVTCPYHPEFLLKCTVDGSTATGSLDTTSATLGKVYTDGGVKWEVIVLPIELGGTGATTGANARKNLNLNLQTFTDIFQLGLDGNATELEIANALPVNSIFIYNINRNLFSNLSIHKQFALVNYARFKVTRINPSNFIFEVWSSASEYFIACGNADSSSVLYVKYANSDKLSMPSDKKISLSLASGDTYTAPADGWLYVNVISPNSDTVCDLILTNTTSWLTTRQRDNWGIHLRAFIPLAKGQIGKVEFENGTLDNANFVYAQSEV